MRSTFTRPPFVGSGIFILALMLALLGCEPTDTGTTDVDTLAVDTTEAADGENLVSTLESDGRFSTLVTAIDSSGLGSTLEGPGPFTIFAPTDVAFSELEEGSTDDLLAPANRQQLRDLLMNHVINGRRPAAEVQGMTSVETMYGDELQVREQDGTVRIAGATVTETDMDASNGIIHVIDQVLHPADAAGDAMADPAASDTL